MEKMIIKNKDITDRVNLRYITGAAIFIVWCIAVFIAVTIYDFGADYIYGKALLIASIVIPICLFRPYKIILDRNRYGVVKSVTRTNRPQSALKGTLERDASTALPVITLTVECFGGKTVVKKYKLKKDQDQLAEALTEYYKSGTTVHFYKGVKFPGRENNIVQLNNIAHRLCIVCGNFDDLKHAECQHCKSSFVD
ncbi:hypothetical protein FACS1894105_05260 [Clostridia bacterium]|nr:hypothetical protein FACS1894105_05260 [Clostridia bacterium]